MKHGQDETIQEIVRKMESEDKLGNTTISEYVEFNLRETLERIDAYLNSKHISGDTDSQGREKPFFNIVTAMVNVWFRATDLDRKNMHIKATKKSHYTLAFLASIRLQEWMNKTSFGVFLNDWGRTLSRYGSAVTKFVEKEGILHAEVVPWNRLIIDPIDFENNVKIEKLWFTPSQLRSRKGYNKKLVKQLLEDVSGVRKTMDGQSKDNKAAYIPIYEVHGELSIATLKRSQGKKPVKGDYDKFVPQMHVVSFVKKKNGNKTFYEDYTLISGKEEKLVYEITHLIKEDGRSLSIGAVEHLFDAQWMINHSSKQIKDHLDLASKAIYQTADGNFVGQNVLNDLETGDILLHAENRPITLLNNKADIAALQSYIQQWQAQGLQENGINEAMINAPKSGSAWRQTQAVLQEAHSLFNVMTQNKGLSLEQMMRKHIIPHLKKKLDTTKEISTILEEHQIKQLDMMYIPNEARRRVNDRIKKSILDGQIVDPSEQEGAIASEEQLLSKALAGLGNQRFIKPSDIKDKTWKEALKDIEWEFDIDPTNENKDTQEILTTLTTALQAIATNPAILQDPNARMIFNKILTEAGSISPIEITTTQALPVPAAAGVGAGNEPVPV